MSSIRYLTGQKIDSEYNSLIFNTLGGVALGIGLFAVSIANLKDHGVLNSNFTNGVAESFVQRSHVQKKADIDLYRLAILSCAASGFWFFKGGNANKRKKEYVSTKDAFLEKMCYSYLK